MARPSRFVRVPTIVALALLAPAGCEAVRYDPAKATRSYPSDLRQDRVADIQVFNDGDAMLLVNATTERFGPSDIWLNQRYLHRVDGIAPGETIRIGLGEFWDVRGEGPFPGGLLRYYPPTPIRLVQLQTGPDAPLIGLRAIPTEREIDAARLRRER